MATTHPLPPERIQDLARKADELARGICAHLAHCSALVMAHRDNPAIHRLSDQAFSLPYRELSKSWSVFYHDWEAQKRRIAMHLERYFSASESRGALDTILNAGRERKCSDYRLRYAPEVVEGMRPMIVATRALRRALSVLVRVESPEPTSGKRP
jgi:hypothetical protein